jgi:uncharacterized protein (DUF885 family)
LRKLWIVWLLLAACSGGAGNGTGNGGPPPPGPPPVGPSPAELLADQLAGLTLDDFYEVSFGALIGRSPESVIEEALTDEYPLASVGLDNLSDDYVLDTFDMVQVVLDALHGYDRAVLDANGKLDYDSYEWYLTDELAGREFRYYDFPAAYSIYGVQEGTRTFFTDIHPLASRQDAEDYITRLNLVRTKFGQLIDHLQAQRNDGIVEPTLTLQIALNQVASMAQGTAQTNPYYTNFVGKVAAIAALGSADRQDIDARALSAVTGVVIPAYQDLRSELQSLQNNAPPVIGVGQYARGSDYYAYVLHHHTTTDLTPAEIHQLGLDELVRIHAEMRAIFDQLGYPQNESLQQLFNRVANDGGIIPAADVKSTYEAIIDSTQQRLDEAFDVFPSADVIVKSDPYGGFYIGPSFDGTRPGAFYAGTTSDQLWYPMPSLTWHESIPGHHLQISIAMEQDAPVFRKIVHFTAFVEGWGLYAERLAWELGWLDGDPYANLGRLQYEALRAARLVIDTGIHDLGWSFADAVQFNNDSVGWTTAASQGAVARYSVYPGQATAYLIGMLKILDERQRALDTLGSKFDLKAFHRALLTNGAVPLGLMDEVVDAYIAEAESAP